jgi:FtsH-binding integral membrane protein
VQTNAPVERRFYTGMAIAMLAVSVAGFLPAIIQTDARRAPVSPLAAAHGTVFFAWLIIYLVQSRLIANRQFVMHRRVGIAASLVLALMIVLGYAATVTMVRRGFDLSGDLRIEQDPAAGATFPLTDILMFGTLAASALAYRHRPEIHKSLMLFANIVLMGAPLAHLIGHIPRLAALPGGIIMIPISAFLIAAVARDYWVSRRVRALTWGLTSTLFLSGPVRSGLLAPSVTWHRIVGWLVR